MFGKPEIIRTWYRTIDDVGSTNQLCDSSRGRNGPQLGIAFWAVVGVVKPIPVGAALALNLALGLILTVQICVIAGTAAIGYSPAAKPSLAKLLPDSGPAGNAYPLQVTIQGTGFAATDNEVQFGPMRLTGIPSPDGHTIVFQVPKEMPSRSEVPPLVFPADDYEVVVTTPAGTSNALTFKLTPGA